jgi:hypothetical protein
MNLSEYVASSERKARSGSSVACEEDYGDFPAKYSPKRAVWKDIMQLYAVTSPSLLVTEHVLIEKKTGILGFGRISEEKLGNFYFLTSSKAPSSLVRNESSVLFLKKNPKSMHIVVEREKNYKKRRILKDTIACDFSVAKITTPKNICVWFEKSSILTGTEVLRPSRSVERGSPGSAYNKLLEKYHHLMDIRERGELSSDQEKEFGTVEKQLEAHEAADLNSLQRLDRAFDDSEEIRQLRELNKNIKELLTRQLR